MPLSTGEEHPVIMSYDCFPNKTTGALAGHTRWRVLREKCTAEDARLPARPNHKGHKISTWCTVEAGVGYHLQDRR